MSFLKLILESFLLFQKQSYVNSLCFIQRERPCTALWVLPNEVTNYDNEVIVFSMPSRHT